MGLLTNIRKAITNMGYSGGMYTNVIPYGFITKNKRDLLTNYKNLVYACVNVIAEEVGRYEPVFTKDGKEINHPFGNILNKPSDSVSKFDLLFASQAYLELTGELYWYIPKGEITKRPKEIILLNPERMYQSIDNGQLVGYVYRRGDGTDMTFEVDEIEAYYMFNPFNAFAGYSTTNAGDLYIEGENATSEFQTNFIKNQATPSGVLNIKKKVSRELFDKIGKQWKREHGGTKNAGKTIFLNGGDVDFVKMGLSISDINMKELKDVTEKKVLQMFRVPSALLGETESNGLGRANIETIEYIFSKRTIEPKLVRLDDFIERVVRSQYKEKVKVEHKSLIPQDMEFKLKMLDSGKDIWLTRNEVRRLSGLEIEDVKGGDDLYIELNKAKINQSEGVGSSNKIVLKVAGSENPSVKKDSDNAFEEIQVVENKESKNIERVLKKLVRKQEKSVLEKVELLSKKVKAFEEFLFELEKMTPEMVQELLPFIIKAIEGGADVIISLGELDIDFVLSQGQRDAVFESTERLMKSFNKETVEKLQKQLAGGLMNNESQAELTKRVESVFEEAKGYRAERIARTESHRAVNQGTAYAYQQQGYKKMKWVAWGGACPFCKSMDGKETLIGKPFISKGDTLVNGEEQFLADYDDVMYADLHPNCRCKLIPV